MTSERSVRTGVRLQSAFVARYELRAGASIDLLTPDELRGGLDEVCSRLLAAYQHANRRNIARHTAAATVDQSGNLGGGYTGPGVELYTCPLGYAARLTRLALTDSQSTPAAPLNDTAATATPPSIQLYRNGVSQDRIELAYPTAPGNNVCPVIGHWAEHSAVHLQGGERLYAAGSGLPEGDTIYIALQVTLAPAAPSLPPTIPRLEPAATA